MDFIVNFKKSPIDYRDFIFLSEKLQIQSPKVLDLRSDLQPVRNQGSQGTCYAQSASCMKEWQEKKNYNNNEYFSPQFFYNLRSNKYDENKNNDYGMFGRDVMNILRTYGICKEVDYPYGLIQHKDEIDQELFDKAKVNIIQSYARIYNIDDLKLSLYINGPALIGFPVYNYGPEMWKQNEGENFKGGHAMTVVGYNNDGFIIRNSWGNSWCDNGYTCYKYEDWGCHWEVWSTVDKKDIFPEDKSEENKSEEDKSEENKSEEDKSEEDKSEEDKSEPEIEDESETKSEDSEDLENEPHASNICPFCVTV